MRGRGLLGMLCALLLAGVAGAGWLAALAWRDYAGIPRFELAHNHARRLLPADPGMPLASAAADLFLIIGSDRRDGEPGERADVILLLVVPHGGGDVVVTSIPRDLWVHDPCSGTEQRINAALNGCGEEVTGPELLAVTVENVTGLPVRHAMELEFFGFTRLVDAAGGIDVCVQRPTREAVGTGLYLPSGCSHVDGQMALNWVRSRHTDELVDGTWQRAPTAGDLERTRRQRELLVGLVRRLGAPDALPRLPKVSATLPAAVRVDASMTVLDATALAWRVRGPAAGGLREERIPILPGEGPGGEAIVTPARPVPEVLREALSGG
jgi:LCP family protein required for cell wall assembly